MVTIREAINQLDKDVREASLILSQDKIEDMSHLIELKGRIEQIISAFSQLDLQTPARDLKGRALQKMVLVQLEQGKGIVARVNGLTQEPSAIPTVAKTALAVAVVAGGAYGVYTYCPEIQAFVATGLSLAQTHGKNALEAIRTAGSTISTKASETYTQVSDTLAGWRTTISGYFSS